jgi:hypothetical protein
LDNEKFGYRYSQSDIIWVVQSRRLRGTGHVGENKNACRVLEGKPKVKTPLKRPIHIWKDNIKWDRRH